MHKNKTNIGRIIKLAKPFIWHFVIISILSIAVVVISSIMPKVLWQMPDIAIADIKNGRDINFEALSKQALIFVFLAFISSLFSLFSSLILARICALFSADLRRQLFQKLSRVSIRFFNKSKTGEIITTITEDTSVIGETLAINLQSGLSKILSIIAAVVMLFVTSWQIAVISVVFSFLIFINTKFFLPKIREAQEQYRKAKGASTSDFEEFFTNQLIIYANSKEEYAIDRLSQKTKKLCDTFSRAIIIESLSSQISKTLLSRTGRIVIWLYGGFSVLRGKMTFGTMQAAIQYYNSLINPVSYIVEIIGSFQETIVAANHIFEILDAKEDPAEEDRKANLSQISGHIKLDQINFKYDGVHAIKNLSLDVKSGTKVAIVGPTGSGKTTLVSLLMKFMTPNSGEIYLDDIPFSNISRKKLRSCFGMVLQESWLSDGTVMENLTYGNNKITKADVRNLMESSGINHIFESLPESYDTKISDSNDILSAGEKQLISIARVMIANPKMIIMDEATSNLDTRTERLIQAAVNKLTKNRTTFIIAHRLSTIVDADLIVVLKDGEIIEQGTHAELLKFHGFYEKLYNSQFEEEETENE